MHGWECAPDTGKNPALLTYHIQGKTMNTEQVSKQLENAQKLNAVISALHYSWTELKGEEIEALMSVASEYGESIKYWLTNKAEGEKSENNQEGAL